MIFFLRVSVKNRNPYLKTLAGRCCSGAFKSGVKGLRREWTAATLKKEACAPQKCQQLR
jgi:hypothetical protein